MVRITKVYTKTGDQGQTKLASGKVIAKTSPRIDALGSIDELNSCLGLAAETLQNKQLFSTLDKKVTRIQNTLFDLGTQIAVLTEDKHKDTPNIQEIDITLLEHEIDAMNNVLPALNSFILPRGGIISAQLHIARTVCRRTERAVTLLNEIEKIDGIEIRYLNRLSDWLFVTARWVAAQLNIPEMLWQPGKRDY